MYPVDFIIQNLQALLQQRWEDVAPLIHQDACAIFSTGEVHCGKEAVKKRL